MKRLTDIMSKLRSDQGCPWDREQTLESLKEQLLEESYEVIDAIDSGDSSKHMEELGDLLLQVVFQSQLRKEKGDFTLDDVIRTVSEKLVRRHPHVFGTDRADTSKEVLKRWEKIKAEEKGDKGRSILAGIPRRLPALLKAQRIQARAARVGFDWEKIEDVVAKVREEMAEVDAAMEGKDPAEFEAEIGDLLFAIVNLCRFRKVTAEQALDRAISRFARRFGKVEERIRAAGRNISDCTLAEMDAHWEAVKKEEA